ncbi:hypothetical protein FRC02_004176 [Tulasnella sp. 418]|nr:hypothetical protein FRC02_004176 [Tulasnella sp. 418]
MTLSSLTVRKCNTEARLAKINKSLRLRHSLLLSFTASITLVFHSLFVPVTTVVSDSLHHKKMHLLHSLLPFFIVTASVCASLDVQPGSGLHKRHNHVAHNRVVARPFGNERRSRLKRAVPNKPQRCRSKKAQNTLTSTVAPETTSAAEPVNTPAPTSEPADVEIEAKKKTSTSAKPKETSGGDSGGSGGGKGKFTGEATFYDTGLTACGITNKDSDFIAAVAASRFDSFPGAGMQILYLVKLLAIILTYSFHFRCQSE